MHVAQAMPSGLFNVKDCIAVSIATPLALSIVTDVIDLALSSLSPALGGVGVVSCLPSSAAPPPPSIAGSLRSVTLLHFNYAKYNAKDL